MRPDVTEVLDRVLGELERYHPGVHQLAEPAFLLDSALPATLAELYRLFDGARLFHEELVLFSSSELRRSGDRFVVGEVAGDVVLVDQVERVLLVEGDSSDEIIDGTAIDRWLSGYVDASAMLYDLDGEFKENVFTESGEIEKHVELSRQRCRVKRDPRAPGPRWRLARTLASNGNNLEARNQLEEVVASAPEFAWAWFDLARISESVGELDGAVDEMVEAASVARSTDYEGYFFAHVARLFAARGDDRERAKAAQNAVAADPKLVENLLRGAEEEIGAGSDAGLLRALLTSIAPRDLRVLDLAQRSPLPTQ